MTDLTGVNMAQAQIDRQLLAVTKEYWIKSPKVTLKVQKTKQDVQVVLYKGKKSISLPLASWKNMLEMADIVQLACQLLEGTALMDPKMP